MTTTVQTRQSRVGDGEHVVQFYDRDADLVRAVGDYLIRAVSEGDAAIVIATEPHRRDFEAELVAGGIDVSRAVADGSLVWLDAAQTLASFVHEAVVDPARFRACLGPVVRAAQHGGRPLKAYGEMVALLWDAGDVLGAIEVEKLWNALGREERFALWCGYHTRSVSGDEHADALHEVCHLHTAVVDASTARFRAGPDAPSAARRFVNALLGCRPYDDRAPTDDAQLVVSELATNAVMHAGSPFSVSVRYDGSAIRIAVHDWNPMLPVLRNGGPAAPSGRGLHLVRMLARDWGVERSPDGKTVWAELALS
jgi:anti-sigma regulatory factor (Ser/Thr protein kinase)